jgi:hypothetical protein
LTLITSTKGAVVLDAKYPSKKRVERDGVLVYAEGDDIPETDVAELEHQGYLTKAESAGANKAESPGANKSRKTTA